MPSARHAALILAVHLSLLSLIGARAERTAMAAQAPAATVTGAAAPHVDRAQLMRELETLASPAYEGRQTGTPGGIKARQWIVEQFGAIGLAPAGTTGYLQSFTVTTRNVRALTASDGLCRTRRGGDRTSWRQSACSLHLRGGKHGHGSASSSFRPGQQAGS